MSSNNKNPNINKFFNKLYLSFPIMLTNKSNKLVNDELNEIKYIYRNKDSSKWFVKGENGNKEVFLFGKIIDNIPQNALLTLTFDNISSYSKGCSGIIKEKQIYINTQYFIDNYPNFKTKLNETTIDVFINHKVNSINVIKLGEYKDNIEKLIENLNLLLDELEEYKKIKNNEINSKIENKHFNDQIKICEICGKKLKKENVICKKCSKKRHAANILNNILKYVEPQTPFTKKDLNQIYSSKIEINDCIWSLEEYNLIKQNNNEYYLENSKKLNLFIEKYSIIKEPVKEIKKEEPKKLNKKCSICNKTLPTSKFYKNNKTNDGFEDYCKKCKNYVNTANYLKDLLKQVNPGDEFKISDLTNNFINPMEFIGRLWELQDFDLLIYNSDKDTYLLTDLKTCQEFLDKYYISGSITIMPKIKKETNVKEFTKKEQMAIVIENIKNGKTDKEAAEIAGINLYKITHWFKEGKNKSSKETIDFYNSYIEAKKEAKINSFKNFYVIEYYNNKPELTIADTLRKQQMENVLKELGSGSSMKTAAFNSSITYETLQYWYKRGKQNFGEEYNEFYEKINILQSPIEIPKPEENNKEHDESQKVNNELSEQYKHILDPLPHKFKQLFKGSKESESGFAWVKRDKNSWRYDRQQKDNRQSLFKQNLYELYDEVINHNYVWGVRDLKKAKETLKQCNMPDIDAGDEEDIFKHILDPIAPVYAKRFKKPNTSGFAWVTKSNNTWGYTNPKDNIRIYDSNIYNLYLKIKKENLPWGVRDLERAKESLTQCKKPTITSEIHENNKQFNSNITCAYFTNDKIIKAIINGKINDDEVIKVINNFKEFEEKLIRIITTRHSKFTELFIEFNLKKSDLSEFKKIINQLNMNSIKETKKKITLEDNNPKYEYTEEYLLEEKSKLTNDLYYSLKSKIMENFENVELIPNKVYLVFKINNEPLVTIVPQQNSLKVYINSKNLHDYKYETRDVSNIGHLGVGDYELKIKSVEDVFYFLDLFKQVYEEKI